jgi:hypothetical protein
MKKGLSGAVVEHQCESEWPFNAAYVRKMGKGTAAQGKYCKELGDTVCPYIFDIDEDFDCYHMEVLKEPSTYVLPYLFAPAKRLLQKHVWARQLPMEQFDWREDLVRFAKDFDLDIKARVYELYPTLRSQNMIHGDPTLANMMFRTAGNVDLVIIDPIRPMGKIPGYKEVDLGKMLQSSLGWEAQLGMVLKFDQSQAKRAILDDESNITRERTYFWCMIHFMRTIPYLSAANMGSSWVWEQIYDLRL